MFVSQYIEVPQLIAYQDIRDDRARVNGRLDTYMHTYIHAYAYTYAKKKDGKVTHQNIISGYSLVGLWVIMIFILGSIF